MSSTLHPNRRSFRTGLALFAALAVALAGASSAIAAGPTERVERNIPPAAERLISAFKPLTAKDKRAIQRQTRQGAKRAKKAVPPSKATKLLKSHDPRDCSMGYVVGLHPGYLGRLDFDLFSLCGWLQWWGEVGVVQRRWNGSYWQEGVSYWTVEAWNCWYYYNYYGYWSC